MFFLLKSAFWIGLVFCYVAWPGEKSAKLLVNAAKDLAIGAQSYAMEEATSACTADLSTCLALAKRAAAMTDAGDEAKPPAQKISPSASVPVNASSPATPNTAQPKSSTVSKIRPTAETASAKRAPMTKSPE